MEQFNPVEMLNIAQCDDGGQVVVNSLRSSQISHHNHRQSMHLASVLMSNSNNELLATERDDNQQHSSSLEASTKIIRIRRRRRRRNLLFSEGDPSIGLYLCLGLTISLVVLLFPTLVASSATYLSQTSASGLSAGNLYATGGLHQLSAVSSSSLLALPALLPINELRVSGSKNEPPSRPSVDWSKHRPHFGNDIVKNVSVELGKTAYLTCKVYELGDKTVSWLRPRENEILTAGKYTYIGDSRFSSINDGGVDWLLEIKDVTMDDSTNYECQISTDPKMSMIISLQVKATKANIKQGEVYYGVVGNNIELQCDVAPTSAHSASSASSSTTATTNSPIYVYWYHNGNLLNYIKDNTRNLTINWDATNNYSKMKLYNAQLSDAGNYSCKPSSAEPASIRLHLRKNHTDNLVGSSGKGPNDRPYYSSGATKDHHVRQDGKIINGLNVHSDSQTSSASARGNNLELILINIYCILMPFCIIYIQQSFLILF